MELIKFEMEKQKEREAKERVSFGFIQVYGMDDKKKRLETY